MRVLIDRPTAEDTARRGDDAAPYRRIVVGVDGSSGSRAALIHALAAAARLSTEVEVVSSYARPVFWAGEYPVDPPVPTSLRADTEARLAEFVDEVRRSPLLAGAQGADTVALRLVVSAHPAIDALLDRAGDDDLLVVGNRGRGAPGSALLGSVALDCVNRAVSSVLVVHSPVGALSTPPLVVVGVDGSAPSRAALRVALEEASRTGAHVAVVHSYELTDYWVDVYPGELPRADEIADQARRRVGDLVGEAMRAAPRNVGLRTVLAEGPALDVLLERAHGAALLVVARRGYTTQPGTAPGSVALQAALRSTCPVLIVPFGVHADAAHARKGNVG